MAGGPGLVDTTHNRRDRLLGCEEQYSWLGPVSKQTRCRVDNDGSIIGEWSVFSRRRGFMIRHNRAAMRATRLDVDLSVFVDTMRRVRLWSAGRVELVVSGGYGSLKAERMRVRRFRDS